MYNLCNQISAISYIENIFLKIESLKYLPYRGASYRNTNNRFIVYKKYLIFYEIQEKENLIRIKRILHSKINKNLIL